MSKHRDTAQKIAEAVQKQREMEMENPEMVEKMSKRLDQEYEKLTEFQKLRVIRTDYFNLMNHAYTMAKYFENNVKMLDKELNNIEIPKDDN